MTNYCQNRLEIEGTADDIASFAQICLTNTGPSEPQGLLMLDFANILPAPKGLDREEAQKWEFDEWGVPPDRVTYDEASLTVTSYAASFSSPWGAPEGIIRAVARLFPRLAIRFVGVEEGNAYCFKLDSRDGVIEAGHPELTDALIEEVEGEGEIEARASSAQDWWEESSQLKRRRMRHFRHWWDEVRLGKALADYPYYIPPHQGLAALMTMAQAEENFAYFLNQRDARIAALTGLLGKFGLRLAFDEATRKILDRWLHRYGGLLYVAETRPSFYTHNPLWDAERRSLNVIFDFGVYLGEFAIRETPSLSWGLDDWNRPKHGSFCESYLRPSLISSSAIRSSRFPRDILADVYRFCDAHCNESYFSKRGGSMHSSQRGAREFFSVAIRDIHLRAIGEDTRADEEARARAFGK
jgi:hypothetical protein